MNAGAYGTQIGPWVREVELYRAATGEVETVRGNDIRFDYRHTSFAADDVMLRVKLELPSKPYKEILAGIKVCNEKRRASQPLNQKSAGCIFKNQILQQPNVHDTLGLRDRAIWKPSTQPGCADSSWPGSRCGTSISSRTPVTIRQGKGNKDRHIPLGDRAAALWMRKYLDESRPKLAASLTTNLPAFLSNAGEPFTAD